MTTTTPRPNRDALNKAIDVYRDAMRPFIVRTLKANAKGATVEEAIRQSLNERARDQFDANLKRDPGNPAAALDVNDFPHIVQRNRSAFSSYGNGLSSEMWIVVEARNPAAHPPDRDMDAERVRTSLSIIAQALDRTNHAAQKAEVEAIRDALTATPPAQPAPPEPQPAPANGKPVPAASGKSAPKTRGASPNLKAWREAIQPRQDVVQGSLGMEKFAAHLQDVNNPKAPPDYANPVTFFAQTYITPGIRELLLNAAKRLGGKGGSPVIQTKTGFGGGKTHSLIALYHFAKSAAALVNSADPKDGERVGREVRGILSDAGLDPDDPPDASIAVLDGTHLNAATGTLWGEMARQLGGDEALRFVEPAIAAGVAPTGEQLDPLLEHVGPCVILIDELVAYARNADAAMRARLYTFVQALTQSVRRSPNAALVVTLLQSEAEVGGEVGVDALRELEGILGRIEAIWEPLRVDEAFEVVRRRLFDDNLDAAERDRTCDAFAQMYARSRKEFPQQMSEARYADRLKQCYPIHPEIFDRLYEDWSATPQFQRTRGVLRLMAIAVSALYRRADASPLLMPANLPLEGQADNSLAAEFKKFLGDGNWSPVLTEVDDDSSRPEDIDKESVRFAEVGGAARRLARAVFFGSAPVGAAKGVDESRVHAAVMQPGHNVADYNDALRRMVDNLHFLYYANGRYYFHVEENLNKAASDRARAIEQRDLDAHVIETLLPEAVGRRRDVVVAPADSAAVPESDEVRLVILPPDKHLRSRSSEAETAAAEPYALNILQHRGDKGRVARNTLIFLAAKADEIRHLRETVRKYLAWFSIVNGGDHGYKIELRGERADQARASIRAADSEMHRALVSAYRWALAPTQRDPQQSEYEFHAVQTSSSGGDVVQAAFDACLQEEQLADKFAPSQLVNLLDQRVWSKDDEPERISIETLWTMFANYVYMPRLRSKTVLQQCVFDGAEQGAFGYADAYRDGEYANLRFRQAPRSPGAVGETGDSVLVRPDKAREIAEAAAAGTVESDGVGPTPGQGGGGTPGTGVLGGVGTPGTSGLGGGVTPWPDDPTAPGASQPPAGPVRLTVRKRVSGEISLDDLGQLRDEIIANLLRDGGEVTIEITGRKPGGFSENAARPVRENSKQLSLEFDEGRDA